jgi:hypothetical protein
MTRRRTARDPSTHAGAVRFARLPHGGRAHNSRSDPAEAHKPASFCSVKDDNLGSGGANAGQSLKTHRRRWPAKRSGGGCVGPHVSNCRMQAKSPLRPPPGMSITMTRWF